MSNPKKELSSGIPCSHSEHVAHDPREADWQLVDLSAGLIERGEEHIVYMKRAEYISDMLGTLASNEAMLEFENIRIGRGLRREVNRISNCDNAQM